MAARTVLGTSPKRPPLLTDRLVAAADLGAAAGKIHVASAKLPTDVEWSQADRLQPNRVKSDADLAFDVSERHGRQRSSARGQM
jgi:hypothetical protein